MYRRSLLEWHNHIVHRIRGTPLFCPCSRIGPQNISVLINENVNLVSSVEESDRPAGINISPALSIRPTRSLTRWTVCAARKSHPLASVHSIVEPSTLPRVVSQRSAQDRAAVSRATCAAQSYFGQACPIGLHTIGQWGRSMARIADLSPPTIASACTSKKALFLNGPCRYSRTKFVPPPNPRL